MKKLTVLLAVAVLTGCATVNAPPPVSQGPSPDKPAPTQPGAPAPPAAPTVPKENEVCLKPDDQSGIKFGLYKPNSDANFSAKPGWTIARPAYQILGSVVFPKAVDPASVTLTIDPAADWTYQAQPVSGAPDTLVAFRYVPAGSKTDEALKWGKPGWITLTVQSARAKDGSDLVPKPVSLKIYAYSLEMQDTHPYLVKCYSSLEVSPGPNGH